MTSMYERMRQEIVVGGGAEEETNAPSTSRAVLSALVIGALLGWLGVKNVWTLVFVAGLLASIFLHEVGHFVTARRTGMKATQFFMGFGPRLWSRQKGEVEYGFRAIPLGALSIDTNRNKMNLPGITFKITPANGGTIITVTTDVREKNHVTLGGYDQEELYIIPDGVEDFDRELGKIITIHRMKQNHE